MVQVAKLHCAIHKIIIIINENNGHLNLLNINRNVTGGDVTSVQDDTGIG